MRLDTFLVQNGLCISKNKANELIKNGYVYVDDKLITKPSFEIIDQKIEIKKEKQYVSRAAEKLLWFLSKHRLDVVNKECLDIGSSTGGFTQVLLEAGAKSVVCVDVGKNQLDSSLRSNKQIELYEETDFRDFKINKRFEIITCDVSFISLFLLLDKIDTLAKDTILLLFKPQFEVGKDAKRNKKGVVLDKVLIEQKKLELKNEAKRLKWTLICELDCEIKGKEGNIETFFCFKK